MTILIAILCALNLLGVAFLIAALNFLYTYMKASDATAALELDLLGEQVEANRAQNFGQHRHTCQYIGQALIEDEVFKALKIPKNPPVSPMVQAQKRAICADEDLRKYFKLTPEVAAKILADLDAEGVPPLPWDTHIVGAGK